MPLHRNQILSRLTPDAQAKTYGLETHELMFDRLLRVPEPKAFLFEAYRFILEREPISFEIEGRLDQLRKGVTRQTILADFVCSFDARLYLKEICGHSSLYDDRTEAQAIDVKTGSLGSLVPHDAKVDLAIVLEFAPTFLERANCSPRNFVSEISAMGFEMGRIDDATGELYPVDHPSLSVSPNLLLSKGMKGVADCLR